MFWHDGKPLQTEATAPLSITDIGVTFGASVFTTLRIYEQNLDHPLTQWKAHCDRIAHSLRAFSWTQPNWPAIRQGCKYLQAEYPILRITIFPDGREWITGRSLPGDLTQNQTDGITAWCAPASYARSLPTHKTGNYLACYLARSEAQKQQAQEAILTDPQGGWLETATGNLWGWDGAQWWTPNDERCLPGLMSYTLRQILLTAGQCAILRSWDNQQPKKFEAIAYSNCVVGLIPIHTVIYGNSRLEYDPHHPRLKALQSQIA